MEAVNSHLNLVDQRHINQSQRIRGVFHQTTGMGHSKAKRTLYGNAISQIDCKPVIAANHCSSVALSGPTTSLPHGFPVKTRISGVSQSNRIIDILLR